jgi:hypothetical protein
MQYKKANANITVGFSYLLLDETNLNATDWEIQKPLLVHSLYKSMFWNNRDEHDIMKPT